MSDSDRSPEDEDLAVVADELATELRALREELEDGRPEPPRGPLGLPRPPSPREFMQFADEVAIPGLIALLEANVKLLEALQRAIRLADRGRRTRDRSREAGSTAVEGAEAVSRRALDRLQTGLEDLQTAIEGGAVPEDRVGGDLLSDIRRLQEEIDERIAESRRTGGEEGHTTRRTGAGNGTGYVGDEANDEEDDGGVPVDVDAELDSLKDRYGDRDEGEDDDDG